MSDELLNNEEANVTDAVTNVGKNKTMADASEAPKLENTEKEETKTELNEKENTVETVTDLETKENSATKVMISENTAETTTAVTEESTADTLKTVTTVDSASELSAETKAADETQHDASESAPSVDKKSECSTMDSEYAEHVNYNEDGCAIYTDPITKFQYKWSTEANNWLPLTGDGTTVATADPYENEHYRWCTKTQQWLPKAQTTETEHYKWDAEKNEWIPKMTECAETKQEPTTTTADVVYGLDEDGQRIYTDKDGAVFFWDTAKKAWFPKIDDDFMARYQMNYGFIDNTSVGEEEQRVKAELEAKRKAEELKRMTEEAISATNASKQSASGAQTAAAGVKRKAPVEPPKWFDMDPQQNTKVYVSNLPLDITLDEFAELMSKCGMIMRDPQTQKYKLKLYAEADGQLKGDGLCDYIKVESVGLALEILDEYNLRGNKIRVQRAKFQMRGEYNPALKPKRKKKDKEKLQKIKEKLFDWRPEKMRGERSKNEKIVIIKNLFHPDIFEKEVQLILDYQNDLREECSKCGTVRKVVIYDRHPEGVAQINMSSPEEADVVIQMMQGRFFGKRQLTAEHWDGKTKYKITESEVEVEKRLTNWDKFLTEDETAEQKAKLHAQEEPDEMNKRLEHEMHAEDDA